MKSDIKRIVFNSERSGRSESFTARLRKFCSEAMRTSKHSPELSVSDDGGLHGDDNPFRLDANWADELDSINRRFRTEILDFISRNKGGVATSLNGFVFVLYVQRLLEFLDFSDSYGKLLLRGKYGVLSKDEFVFYLSRIVREKSICGCKNGIQCGGNSNEFVSGKSHVSSCCDCDCLCESFNRNTQAETSDEVKK